VASPTFEEAYRRLEAAVEQLSAGGLPLEESLRLFEQGMALANYCSTLLDRAELRVQQVGQLPPDELAAFLDPEARAAAADTPTPPPAARPAGRSAAPDPATTRPTPFGGGGGARRPASTTPERPATRRNPDYDPLFDEEL
jgi:exodeoxyribonuclease VII small subunit